GIGEGVGGKAIGEYVEAGDGTVGLRGVRTAEGTVGGVGIGLIVRRVVAGAWVGVGAALTAAVEESITGSEHSFLGEAIGEADARGEVVKVGLDEAITPSRADRDYGSELRGERGGLALGNDQRL